MSTELLTFIARSADGLILSETWDPSDSQHKSEAKKILCKLNNAPPRCSIDAKDVSFHYIIENGVCVLTMASKPFPKRIIFAFLEDIMRGFNDELKRLLGSSVDFRSYIETITKPYFFIAFDRTVQKKRLEYRDPNNSKAVSRLNDGLVEINSIMRKSLDDILQRGEALDDVSRRADDLKEASKKFAKQAYNLNLQALLRKYGMIATVVIVVLFIFWLRFF